MPQFIATCATSLEYLLKDELTALGAENAKEGLSQVSFDADWSCVYRLLMWSRVASRILYPIASFDAPDDKTLYEQASYIDWSQHIKVGSSFLVNSQSFRSALSHTQYISQKIKDAVVDHFTEAGDKRPDVEFEEPEVVIHCRIKRDKVTLSIDLAGRGLHNRNYRLQGGGAPIKENLAAALLMRAGWNDSKQCLFDPMCGSGTFLIEGAMMSLGIAPGVLREYLGIFGWQQFQPTIWEKVKADAEQQKINALESCEIQFIGCDVNPRAIKNAQMNVSLAGLSNIIKLNINALDQVEQLKLPSNGLLIVNPPYSERLGERNQVEALYSELGELLKTHFIGWQASVLSPDKQFGHALGIRAQKIYKFNNGSIACELLNFSIDQAHFLTRVSNTDIDDDFKSKLSPQAEQLCNRIEKNKSKLKKFLLKEQITCYRVYDADLPEYNAAIDVYGDCLHIQEYKAPKSIDEKTAKRRFKEIERVAAGVFKMPRNKVFSKQRQQQKGDWQYQKSEFNSSKEDFFFTVLESGRKFWVNLNDYLDTGLFLDHRKTRQIIADKSRGKRLLNLFCYTASISVYAATAGAKSTCNVDMSRTYLDWAKRNFSLNNIDLNKNQLIREDCIEWLKDAVESKQKFDVIFLDPPTFSNSKKMESYFDIQKDHPWLIEQCVSLLANDGELIFSNNFKKFDMQVNSNNTLEVKEITHQTESPDFSRSNLHRCWSIKLKIN